MGRNKKLQDDLIGNKSIINELIKKINSQENLTVELENNKYKKNTFDEEEKINNYFSDSLVHSMDSLDNKAYPYYSKKRKNILYKILFEYNLKLKHGFEINEDISIINTQIKKNHELISKEFLFINNKLDYSQYINNIYFRYYISFLSF